MLGVIQGRREGGRRGDIPKACSSFGGNYHVKSRWVPPGQVRHLLVGADAGQSPPSRDLA